jgi:hypothetical protein
MKRLKKANEDYSEKRAIMDFIGTTPWNKIKIVGIEEDGDRINTKLSEYSDIDDLLSVIETNPPVELQLVLPNKQKFTII